VLSFVGSLRIVGRNRTKKGSWKVECRGLPPPWTAEQIPGGLKVIDANGQSLA
jgi:hypothetical protein